MICTIILTISAKQRDFRAILTNIIVNNAQKLLNSFILSVWILVAGLQLIRILKKCLHNQSKEGSGDNVSIEAIRHGLFKARVTMAIGISFMVAFISLSSTQIFMMLTHYTDIICWVCFSILLYSPALCTTLIVIVIVYNPKALNPLSGSFSTSQSFDNAEFTESSFTEHLGESTLVASHVETPNFVFKS
ncbi:hypothetical protein [Parasitella parasitica]|uniref:Uncharacterized protein n=1 Tax=Parasitella parasitica TaxID=35722 RepID=A0A0B7NB78_9FUNG|nr:hypothetical protein [Parasitella parasitica]